MHGDIHRVSIYSSITLHFVEVMTVIRAYLFVFLLWFFVKSAKPPKEPPAELLEQYTRHGAIELKSFYVDDTNNGKDTHFKFTGKSMESYIKGTKKLFNKLSPLYEANKGDPTAVPLNSVLPRDWIYFALLSEHRVFEHANSVVVFGSAEPSMELAVLGLGASSVTTVEYNMLTYEHPQITTISKQDFDSLYSCKRDNRSQTIVKQDDVPLVEQGSSTDPDLAAAAPAERRVRGGVGDGVEVEVRGACADSFDVALSISSFDHDGLGRYGDPLNPDGDLLAMRRAMQLLRPGGLLVLTVPVGADLVVFNLLRRYGPVRLPLLLAGWEVVRRYFWEEDRYSDDRNDNFRKSYEPVLVLRKPLTVSDSGIPNDSSSSSAIGAGSDEL
jgi:hypothetical protein